ncbi:hypothetical protein KUTeg_015432 [Tegillarca granosa]|uniref:Uncharacterized protein n=1 Tax=Tegillarca granosa TaxID=220873 RepID=A0ABQ9EVL6_TEGGR|nr:hypothetical protein KUTeg_015432 [Tegillarca granosa]
MAMDFTISIFVLCIIFLYFTLSTSGELMMLIIIYNSLLIMESNTLTETSSLQPIRTTELTTDGTGIFFQRKTTHDISTNTTTNAENLNFVNEISASSRGGIIAGAVIAVQAIS